MKKLIWIVVVLATFNLTVRGNAAVGANPPPGEKGIPVEKIEKALTSYTDALGCGLQFDESNVVQFDPTGDNARTTYVVLFFLDTGCTGGSSMGSSQFAVLSRASHGRYEFLVVPEVSQPATPSFGFPRFIDRVFVKGKQLWYSGRVHDWSKDTPNAPSVLVEGQVLLREGVVALDKKQDFGARYWLSVPQQTGR